MYKTINITAKPRPEADICDFHLDQIIHHGADVVCRNSEQARDSELLQALIDNDDIKQVVLSSQRISVLKSPNTTWLSLGKLIGYTIRTHINNNKSISPTTAPVNNELRVTELQQLLDTTINPQVASHGGHIEVVKAELDAVYVKLSGGCQGCSQSAVTVKNGVEHIIKHHYPQVNKIIDITAHEQGANPFY